MKIEKIEITGVRGIRHTIEISLMNGTKPTSAIIYGRNGTGKSSIVDAWELFQTEKIDHLAREGARQSAYKNRDGDQMDIKVSIIDENGPSIVSLSQGGTALSKFREAVPRPCQIRFSDLKSFVSKSKGDMFLELSELMGLRPQAAYLKDLQKVQRSLKKELVRSEQSLNGHPSSAALRNELLALLRSLDLQVGELTDDSIAQQLTAALEQLIGSDGDAGHRQRLLENAVLDTSDLEQLRKSMSVFLDTRNDVLEGLRIALFETAQQILNAEELSADLPCPLCDQTTHGLGTHVQERLAAMAEVRVAKNELEGDGKTVRGQASTWKTVFESISTCQSFSGELQEATARGQNFLKTLIDLVEQPVDTFDVESLQTLDDCISALAEFHTVRDLEALELADATSEKGEARAAIRGRLIELEREVQQSRAAERNVQILSKRLSGIDDIVEHYRQKNLESLHLEFQKISTYVAKYFGILEAANAGFSDARIELDSSGEAVRLALSVYGKDESPAYRVLSESQLNSFGLAIHLAELRVHSPKLKFLILDDVINSFDSYKRPQVIRLLQEEFADFQIIVLTHDDIWRERLYSSFRNWQKLETRGYCPELGTQFKADWKVTGRLDAVVAKLDNDRPQEAGALFGPYVEAHLHALCEAFQASLKYQVDNRHTMDPLLQALRLRCEDKLGSDHHLTRLITRFEGLQFFRNWTAHEKNFVNNLCPDEVQTALDSWLEIEAEVVCQKCHRHLIYYGDKISLFRCRSGHQALSKAA